MRQHRIALFVGSLRRDSTNRKLAAALARLAPSDFMLAPVEIGDLPLYRQDDEDPPSPAVTRLKREIQVSAGMLFVTPEYNRSIPGVLKNAIDHASRPYGKHVFVGRPAGIIGVSIGVLGTAMAQQHLRNILAYLDVPTLGQPEAFIQAKPDLFDSDGGIGEASRAFLQTYMDRFAAWVRRHSQSPPA